MKHVYDADRDDKRCINADEITVSQLVVYISYNHQSHAALIADRSSQRVSRLLTVV